MKYTDKSIGFNSNLVAGILDGSKTFTYRLGDYWDFLKVGDSILASDSNTQKVFAEIRILHKEEGTFGTLQDDQEGHNMHRTLEERRATYEKYYNRPITDNDPVLILGFKIIKKL